MNDRHLTLASPTLFVSDLDGTLLGADSRLSPQSVALLNDAIADGKLVTVATARTPATVGPLMKKVNLQLPLIVMTGAALWNPLTGHYDMIHHMATADEAAVRQICEECGLKPFVYTLTGGDSIVHCWHPAAMTSRERKFADERSNLSLKRMHIGDLRYNNLFDNAVLIFAIGNWLDIKRCGEIIESATSCSVSAYRDIFNHSAGLLEVFAPGVSKAAALAELRAISGAASTVVFGDNLNDIPMIKAADRGVAVANAFDEVRQAACEIIGPNTEDSVARYVFTYGKRR